MPNPDEPIAPPLRELLDTVIELWDERALTDSHPPAQQVMAELRDVLESDDELRVHT